MEHFDLEDMFGRRQKPDLSLMAHQMNPLGEKDRTTFVLQNSGRALAKHVGFLATFENAEISDTSRQMQNLTNLNNGKATVSYAEDHGVVHPVSFGMNAGWVSFARLEKDKPVVIHVTWYCENMTSREATFET
jgi:hypothetical protein